MPRDLTASNEARIYALVQELIELIAEGRDIGSATDDWVYEGLNALAGAAAAIECRPDMVLRDQLITFFDQALANCRIGSLMERETLAGIMTGSA